jgi:hypothetical protein
VPRKSITVLQCLWLPHCVFCVRPAVGNRTVTCCVHYFFMDTEDSTGAIIRELE